MGQRATNAWNRKQITDELGKLRTRKLDATVPSVKIEIQGQIDVLLDVLNATADAPI